MSGAKQEGVKVGFLQVFIAVIIIAGLFWVFQMKLIPMGSAGFVRPLFKPSGDMLEKIGFVHFNGDNHSKNNPLKIERINYDYEGRPSSTTILEYDYEYNEKDYAISRTRLHEYEKDREEYIYDCD